MKLWEKLSGTIYKLIARPYLKTFKDRSVEATLKRSVQVMDTGAVNQIKNYIRDLRTTSGGFPDKAGKPDMYYTLFGFFVAETLDLKEILFSVADYVKDEMRNDYPTGVHLYCAAILYAKTGMDTSVKKNLRKKVRLALKDQLTKQPAYTAFLTLLACYYLEDYKGLYLIKKHIKNINKLTKLPGPVLAALLVLQQSFHQPVDDLKTRVLSFYDDKGGFKATDTAPVSDLLSTAVALYALHFAGADLRTIKPDCLQFTDSMYNEGGFSGTLLDPDPDVEYTFYGLLALGALSN